MSREGLEHLDTLVVCVLSCHEDGRRPVFLGVVGLGSELEAKATDRRGVPVLTRNAHTRST